MKSLRKPKRLNIFGSNEKQYYFLIKGVEDVRLDQRIENLFNLMNSIFEQDPKCSKNQISLATYDI